MVSRWVTQKRKFASHFFFSATRISKKGLPPKKQQSFIHRLVLLLSVNGALPTVLAHALKLDGAVNQGEQGIILADTNVGAGMDVGASLANQDVASQNELTVSTLAAQTLGLGITAVLGGTAALVVSEELNTNLQHCITPPKLRYCRDNRPADCTDTASFRRGTPGRSLLHRSLWGGSE